MYSDSAHNNKQKTLVSFFVIVAVLIVTVGVNALRSKPVANTALVSTTTPTNATTTTPTTGSTNSMGSSMMSSYKDGTYSATASYDTPGGMEGIKVQLTIKNGAVADSAVQNQSNNRDSEAYQSAFSDSYKSYVVGMKLSGLNLSSVSGSSLTTLGFNEALTQIKNQSQTS